MSLEVRIGLHVGDIDRRGDDVAGQAATFEPLGPHDLKGIPGTWELFRSVFGD